MRRAYGIAMVVGLLALQAMACMPDVERPEIQLDGARLASVGLNGGVVDVRLSVHNPNRFSLQASGLTYDLDIEDPESGDWVDFTDGRLDRDVVVAPGATEIVVIPVEFTFRSLGDIAGALLDRGTFDYRVSGQVAVEEPLRRDIDYRHTGQVTPSGVR